MTPPAPLQIRRGAAVTPASGLLPDLQGPQADPAPPLPEGLARYRIETWGCQMNEHDSERMAAILSGMGLSPASDESDADIILLNTCSVREKAAEKLFSRLGRLQRLKQARPGMVIGVAGCVAQQEQEAIFRRAPSVDLVMGPRRLGELPRLVEESRRHRRAMAVFDPKETLVPEPGEARRVSRTRAWVTVMEGCNKSCSFCIVPVTRGRESCRHPESILREIRDAVAQGFVEVELLGQNVNAWRHAAGEPWDFTALLSAVASLPGVRRLRFTTSHPLHFKDSIIEVMATRDPICRHLHLPVQSGSDRVLREMRRGYTAADYRDRVRRLRDRVPEVALSTDIIVGFPTESEEDFRLTLDLVREIAFDSIYSFSYSERPGTLAASQADDVPEEEKRERLLRLQEIQDAIQLERNRRWIGRSVPVLIEGPAPFPEGHLTGRTSQNHRVIVKGSPSMVGRIVDLSIVAATRHSLRASLPPAA